MMIDSEATASTDARKEAIASADVDGDGSLVDDLRALADDVQTAFEAERAFQTERATFVLNRSKGIAGLLLLALGCVYFAMVALVVGLLLALIPLVTVWGALAIVGVSLLLLGFIALSMARTRLRRMRAAAMPPPLKAVP